MTDSATALPPHDASKEAVHRVTRKILAVALAAGIAVAGASVWEVYGSKSASCTWTILNSRDPSLTPQLLLNAPYLGTSRGTEETWTNNSSGSHLSSQTLYGLNGTAWGAFENSNWTLLQNCHGQFRATITFEVGGVTSPLGLNLTSDKSETNSSGGQGTTYPVLYFDNSYRHQNLMVSTCGSGPVNRSFASTYYTVTVPFHSGLVLENLTETYHMLTIYDYSFPANGGTWAIDNLTSPGGPGGGWAFSYSPCTA